MANDPDPDTSPVPGEHDEATIDDELRIHTLPPPWDRIFSLGSRLFVWSVLAGVIYLLQPFFLLLFLTFVFAYILEHGVNGLQHRIPNRPLRVVLVASVFLSMLILIGVFVTPHFADQARNLQRNFPEYLDVLDAKLAELRSNHSLHSWIPEDMKVSELIRGFFGFSPEEDMTGLTTADAADERRRLVLQLVGFVQNVGPRLLTIGSSFLLALLLSFLIVLDLPALARNVASLERTKLRFMYLAAAPNIREFGAVLGRALEAQLFIALCNTGLTAIGLWILGMTGNLVFFSTVVFLFSFIPVVGVFISSTPICIEALTESGFELMFAVIVMVTVVHLIEAYFLNPRIFGHHLRMNPVLVLIVLIVFGKLFGVWGLILGLPIVNYFFTRAIRLRMKGSAVAIPVSTGTTPPPA
jgi:predicted PurR-regulated permease PerM